MVTTNKKYAIVIDHQEYEDDIDEISSWTEHHPTLYSTEAIARMALNKLMKEEFTDLVISRGNDEDYYLDEEEKAIYDSETGYDIPVSTYRIVEYTEGL